MILQDFVKMKTFLRVADERSLSKASLKLNISQPAVTQHIKGIESALECRLIERRKSGVLLTKEGKCLYRIASRLAAQLEEGERELEKIIRKETPLILAACPVVGNYILPCCIHDIQETVGNISVVIKPSVEIHALLDNKQADIAIFLPPQRVSSATYREWLEDEIVICSNRPLPQAVTAESIEQYDWLMRGEASQAKSMVDHALKSLGTDCSKLFKPYHTFSEIAAVKQAVLKCSKTQSRPTAALISRFAVADEVARGDLYVSRFANCDIRRMFYIAYLKERKNDERIKTTVDFLLQNKERAQK
ncbi:MAG: LysR family transcriptional regulator [Helicobacteraceae bacterium]|jgi:DNA-binding transcriptional LysR family regulator|nr:LysR family transcriptional regulator [Helicobacteraceae bacterium]